jgi:UDP-N-acetylmuramate dehydrogenase
MTIAENQELKTLTTMRVGGPARYVLTIMDKEDISDAVHFAESKRLPLLVLGGGSNIIFPDHGFDGVIALMRNKGISFSEKEGNKSVKVTAQAGEIWDDVVLTTIQKELYGLENLSYIPGTVGAAPVQNIGAYGREAKDVIESVEVFDTQKQEFFILSNKECLFGYRDSIFKHHEGKHLIVVSVNFLLAADKDVSLSYQDLAAELARQGISDPTARHIRDAVITVRKSKLPEVSEVGTAGSFFKNPVISREEHDRLVKKFPTAKFIELPDGTVKVSAAWLIEHVGGWKGYRKGDAGIYAKHSLVLVNYERAEAKEIISLAEKVEKTIFDETKIVLEREVVVLK